jgi:hypothetical protein
MDLAETPPASSSTRAAVVQQNRLPPANLAEPVVLGEAIAASRAILGAERPVQHEAGLGGPLPVGCPMACSAPADKKRAAGAKKRPAAATTDAVAASPVRAVRTEDAARASELVGCEASCSTHAAKKKRPAAATTSAASAKKGKARVARDGAPEPVAATVAKDAGPGAAPDLAAVAEFNLDSWMLPPGGLCGRTVETTKVPLRMQACGEHLGGFY